MEKITLSIAIIGSILVSTLKPTKAAFVFLTVLLIYPCYLTFNIGTINLTASRIIAMVFLTRCVATPSIQKQFRWNRLDTWIVVSMCVYVGVTFITIPFSRALENRGGFVTDTCFSYFILRMCIADHESLSKVLKLTSVTLVLIAFLGVIETVTGWQPFAVTMQYCPWYQKGLSIQSRWGFARAIGPFAHSILFGSIFILFLPMIYSLRHDPQWKRKALFVSSMAVIGTLSSMSSGPWVMLMIVVFCLFLEKYKSMVKPLLWILVIGCIFISLGSNRPFYHVIVSYANPLGGSAWHRAKLIDVAIKHFDEWWLLGYGQNDPGWGHYFGMTFTDVTNEFILAGVKYGLAGMLVLVGVVVSAMRGIVKSYRRTKDFRLKSFYWALGCVMTTVIITWMSVSFFGQLMALFYCFLGMVGSSFGFVSGSTICAKANNITRSFRKKVLLRSENGDG